MEPNESGRASGSRGGGGAGRGLDDFPAAGIFFLSTLQMLLLFTREPNCVATKKWFFFNS